MNELCRGLSGSSHREAGPRRQGSPHLWGLIVLACMAAGATQTAKAQDVDLSRPLSLEEVIRLGEERNLGFIQSVLGVESADAAYTSSRAQLLPSLNSSLSYRRSIANFNQPRIDTETGQVLEANTTNVSVESSFSVSGGVRLIDPSAWQSVRQSSIGRETTRMGVARARQDLAYSMTQRYYELIRAKQLTQVNAEAFVLSQEQLARAEALYELGSVARSDVLQAQVNLASADRDRISALNRVQDEQARLAVAIGAPVSTPIDVVDPGALSSEVDMGDESDLIREALRQRPDITQASLEIKAAEAGLSSSKWDRWPTLSASYSWSKRGDAPDDVLSDFGRDYNYGGSIGLNWTLFDGFNTKGAIQRAEANLSTRETILEETELNAALQIRQAQLGIKNASEGIRSAEEGVRLAEESAKLQQALYESGGGTLLEWNNAQVELTRARVSLVEAQVDLRLALAQLELAVGRLQAR